ncbi:uncharacterized protein TNCV_2750591 [Trichonephila clavipes]|nr:uncharacterized protein TNCV_2750591 [Trichonephila clavipes]
MVMSETHSEKRKFGKAGESSVNKKARREVSKKYGKFTEDCIPDGVFPIGDDVFVFASTYYDSASPPERKGLKQPQTFAEELWGNREETFNSYVSSFEANEIADCFYHNLFENEHFLLLKPVHYVTQEFLKNLRLDIILREKDAYTLHKPVRHKFQRNRVFVSDIDRQFQADLVDMQSLAEFNKGYKYLLTCIDLFSKFARAVPLKDKFGKSVKSGLEIIFKERKRKVLQTDAVKGGKTIGKEVLMTGSRVASDVLSGEHFKEAVKTRSRESGKKLAQKAIDRVQSMVGKGQYKRKHSPECVKTELELFKLPRTQTVTQDGQCKQFHPLSNVFDNAPVAFHISGRPEDYKDQSNTIIRKSKNSKSGQYTYY